MCVLICQSEILSDARICQMSLRSSKIGPGSYDWDRLKLPALEFSIATLQMSFQPWMTLDDTEQPGVTDGCTAQWRDIARSAVLHGARRSVTTKPSPNAANYELVVDGIKLGELHRWIKWSCHSTSLGANSATATRKFVHILADTSFCASDVQGYRTVVNK